MTKVPRTDPDSLPPPGEPDEDEFEDEIVREGFRRAARSWKSAVTT